MFRRRETTGDVEDIQEGGRVLRPSRGLPLLHVLHQGVQQDERPVRHLDGAGLRRALVPWLLRVLRGGVLWRVRVVVRARGVYITRVGGSLWVSYCVECLIKNDQAVFGCTTCP